MHSYEGLSVAVLGASGFIGRWVARKLCAAGARACLVVRNGKAARPVFDQFGIRGEILEADLSDLSALADLYRHIRPLVTFNLAGYGVDRSERDECLLTQINSALPAALCNTIARTRDAGWRGQHLIHVGSAAEYGQAGGKLHEDGAALPETIYGKSKLEGTRILTERCAALGLRGLTARLFTVYGPGEHSGRLLPSLIEAAQTGRPLDLTAGAQQRDFTYVEDVAEGLLQLGLVSASAPAVNVATGRLTTVRGFAEIAAPILGIESQNLRFGAIPGRPEEMQHEPVALDRLRRLTGWVPSTGIAEGIRKSVETGLLGRTEPIEYGYRNGGRTLRP